jgi:DNA-binding response OmpR family regulator
MDTKPRVLLVDDETAITDNLAPLLERSGYMVRVAGDGEAALLHVASFQPHLIISDVLMPRMDGREMLRRLREAKNWTPVILLTQIGSSTERAMALDEGADDYLNKPFDPYELVARVRSVLRRVQTGKPSLTASERLTSGPLVLDRAARRVKLGNQTLALTPKAVTLLEYLMTHPDELITRNRLLEVVWGWDYPAGARAVDTRVAELRKAIGDDPAHPRYIETVPGQGYRFIGAVETAV